MSFGSSLLSHSHALQILSNNNRNRTSHFKATAQVPNFLFADCAEDVVHYQLEALKYNDQPRPNYGIEVMYRFAGFDPFERYILLLRYVNVEIDANPYNYSFDL
ncbi:hypothetical protein JHK85_046286 [Glycine max]|nr:hypothetical protein JHK85_046286 [Glycine max]